MRLMEITVPENAEGQLKTEDLQMKQQSNTKKTFLLLMMISMSAILLSCASLKNTEDVARIGPDEARTAVANNEALDGVQNAETEIGCVSICIKEQQCTQL